MTALAYRLQRHIDEIVRYHGIIVIEKAGAHARAERLKVDGAKVQRIVIRPIKGRTSYFVALHELGHHIAPRPGRRLEQEVVAWRWALEHAIVKPTPTVWKKIARCLHSYVSRAERWASMKLPPADHDFWKLLNEAEERST